MARNSTGEEQASASEDRTRTWKALAEIKRIGSTMSEVLSDSLEQQQQSITRENATAKKPDGLQCWYCKKNKSLHLCAAGKPLHKAYTAALHRRNQMGYLDQSNPEHYDAWLAMDRALLAYWGHQFGEPIDDNAHEEAR